LRDGPVRRAPQFASAARSRVHGRVPGLDWLRRGPLPCGPLATSTGTASYSRASGYSTTSGYATPIQIDQPLGMPVLTGLRTIARSRNGVSAKLTTLRAARGATRTHAARLDHSGGLPFGPLTDQPLRLGEYLSQRSVFSVRAPSYGYRTTSGYSADAGYRRPPA
jgi:hypothetical protein